MNKNIIYITFFIALLSLFYSCDNKSKEEFLDDYSSILCFLKSGEQDVKMYNTGDPTTHTISISKAGYNIGATATAKVEVFSQADLDAYNSDNGTSFKVLPENSYEFLSDLNLNFKSADTYKTVDIVFKSDIINPLGTEYILPLALVSQTEVYAEKQNVFLKPIMTDVTVDFGELKNNEVNFSSNKTTKDISVQLSIDNKWDFNCSIAADKSLVEAYNVKNGTNYSFITEGSYILKNNGKLNFASGVKETSLNIEFDRTKMDEGIFLLPLQINECSKKEFVKGNPIYLIVNNERMQKVDLKVNMLSTNALEPTEGSLANLLDNDISTYFHSAWSVSVSGSHYLQVDLGESLSEFSFNFTGRASGGNGNPAEIIITGSTDGKTFFDITTITDDKLPTGAAATFASDVIKTKSAKILRFTVSKNKTGGAFFVFSEFGIKKALY